MQHAARASPDITMFRIGKLVFVGGASGQNCEMTAASRAMRCSNAFFAGYVRRRPVPMTATVRPPCSRAARCVAVSMPSARPLTTV
jgi:hypothetical protein